MKSLKFLWITLAAAAIAAAPVMRAQDEKPATPGEAKAERPRGEKGEKGEKGRRGGMNPQARIEMLDRAVTLTAEQKTKAQEIYAKEVEQMQALRGNGGDMEANRERIGEIRRETREQIAALLTPEQREKFREMADNAKGEGKGKKRKKDE